MMRNNTQHVKKIVTDLWRGLLDVQEIESNAPSKEEVDSAIQKLDGKTRTMVILRGAGESLLAIGGGENDQFIVYGSLDGQNFFDLCVEKISSGTVLLHIGGQPGNYPNNSIVNLALALRAARHYYETADLDRKLLWL